MKLCLFVLFLYTFVILKQARDNLPQSEQTLINFYAFLEHLPNAASDRLSLTASQIYQL